ncbi:MAG: 4Fe-4S binding protein [Lentimicrobiaceae bacterium]|nr:4Fe-4S binding protein [Lentimicrobiaceae bacterium]
MKIINKILNYLIVAMLLFFVAENIISSQSSTLKVQSSAEPKYNLTLTLDDAKKNFPEADSLALEDVNLYNVFDDGNKIGTIVNTSPFSDEIYGYNSTTPLTIFLDENDRISEVEICENRETRGYLNKVINSGYLDLWDGLTPKEASTYNVDAVSGCTFTSIAVAQSLQVRMQDLSKEKGKMAIDRKLLARHICIVLVTILAAICFFNPNKTKILRYVTLLLSIAILGFWTNSLLSLALFYNWMTNGISLAIQLPLLIIALLAILLPLFTKKSFYCQYLCPFGAAQEFVGVIGQKAKGNRQKTSSVKSKVFNFFVVFRKVILLVLLLIVALGVGLDLSVVEPFPIFNYQSIGFGVAIFAAVIIVASVFIKKPWCNYLCPTGTLLESFRRLRN